VKFVGYEILKWAIKHQHLGARLTNGIPDIQSLNSKPNINLKQITRTRYMFMFTKEML
jgi:hypothetical protein